MENPKLRIESDGYITEVYIDGKKVEKAFLCEFTAECQDVNCLIERRKTDCNGKIVLNSQKTAVENEVAFKMSSGEVIENKVV